MGERCRDDARHRNGERGERARFSAAGDIRALYELGCAGRQDEMLTFWRDDIRSMS
jgi:hypothetical protein